MNIIFKKTFKYYLLILILVISICALNIYLVKMKELDSVILWQKNLW